MSKKILAFSVSFDGNWWNAYCEKLDIWEDYYSSRGSAISGMLCELSSRGYLGTCTN